MDIISGLAGNFRGNMENIGVLAPANAAPISSSYPGVDPIPYQTGLQKNWPLIAALGGTALETLYGPNDFDPFLTQVGKSARGVGQSALMQRNLNEGKASTNDYYKQLIAKLGGEAGDPSNKLVDSITTNAKGTTLKLLPSGLSGTEPGKVGAAAPETSQIAPNFNLTTPVTPPQATPPTKGPSLMDYLGGSNYNVRDLLPF
jgi:hypothetical protein